MKLFHFYRDKDHTGVSGTGPVVEGVQFTNGWCALRWITPQSSMCFYQSIEDVKAVHGHQGMTEIILHDLEAFETQKYPQKSPNFELFLKVIEEISRVINIAESDGMDPIEIKESVEASKQLIQKIETNLLQVSKRSA
jgi:hypothetical protein